MEKIADPLEREMVLMTLKSKNFMRAMEEEENKRNDSETAVMIN